MPKRCSFCQEKFQPEDVQCQSSLFGAAGRFLICLTCSDMEEAFFDANGTNDLPDLLDHYTL